MSTQPFPVDRLNKAKEEQRRQAQRSDYLYLAGAVMVTIGTGLFHWKLAPVAAGTFCLLPPLLELASAFVKGMRAAPRRQ